MPNASTALLHALLARGDYLEQFTQDQLRTLLPILERAHSDVLGRIVLRPEAGTKTEYDAWLAEEAANINEIYQAAAAKMAGRAMPELEKLAGDETDWINGESARIMAGVSFATPAAATLWASITALPAAAGSTLGQLFEALGVSAPADAISAIQESMAAGETVDQLTRRLRGEVVKRATWSKDADGVQRYHPGVYEGGAMTGSTRDAEMLARTAVMHVGNQAREAFYSQNSDVIKAVQYVATLDLDTCLICGSLDGEVYEGDEGRPELPLHPRCRCLYVPVMKSFRDLGIAMDQLPPSTRASMDGQVPEFETYADRLAKASPSRRIEMLGPARAALYEKGVSLDSMVKDGAVVPLKDMRISKEKAKGAA